MSKEFFAALQDRRSIYPIGKDVNVSDERIQEIVNEAVKHTPSSFNSQSARVVVLLGEQHDKLWNITENTLKAIVPEEQFTPTAEKMAMFRNGYGTVLFFEDQEVIEGLQTTFAAYADNFPGFSLQSAGMLQFVIWTALSIDGLGATLQHYNPLIDDEVKKEWNIPTSWKLLAEMPFGSPLAPAGEKQFAPLEDRVRVYK